MNGPFRHRESRKRRQHSRSISLACHLELCFKVASGRLLTAAPSRRRSLRGRVRGGVRGPGAQWVPGRRPAPRARARALGGARGVRAVAVCSREGACPFAGRRVPKGPRPRARGCVEWRVSPCGAGSTCLQTDRGLLCSEETQGCETERAVSVFHLPPHKMPPAPDATEPQEAANGCYHRCVQTGSPGLYRTGRPGSAPGLATCPSPSGSQGFLFQGNVRSIAEGKPSFGVLTVKAHVDMFYSPQTL